MPKVKTSIEQPAFPEVQFHENLVTPVVEATVNVVTAAPVPAAPTPFLLVDLPSVNQIVRNQRSLYDGSLLDDPINLSRFRDAFQSELGELIEDVVEIAYLRTFPHLIASRQRRKESVVEEVVESSDDEDEPEDDDDSHDFEYKTHCEECESTWWEDHDLESCIEENVVGSCLSHQNHSGSECNWNSECGVHQNHTLSECKDNCHESHSEEDWHLAIDAGGVDRFFHDSYFPACTYFADAHLKTSELTF